MIVYISSKVSHSQSPDFDKEINRPTIASLFSCGGMVEVGATMAGFYPIWGVEFDPDKPQLSTAFADCYEANIGAHVVRQPVQLVDWGQLESPDLLWASPVCTRMSAANVNKGEADKDLELAQAICSAISTLKPKAFCLENVRAYSKSRSLQLIRDTLNLLGYGISETLVNAADYGVPQSRVRFILRAMRGQFPPALPSIVLHTSGWYSAIADLIPTLPDSDLAPWQLERLTAQIKTTLIDSKNAVYRDSRTYGEYAEFAFPITNALDNMPHAFLIERSGARSDRPLLVKAASEPCWTLRAAIGTDQNGNNRNNVINAWLESGRVVTLTPRALARLQTLPDSYQLPLEMKVACPLIGNGVPCKLVQTILSGIKPLVASSPS